jgi:hypothetical protein
MIGLLVIFEAEPVWTAMVAATAWRGISNIREIALVQVQDEYRDCEARQLGN